MVLAFARSKTVAEIRQQWAQIRGEQALLDLAGDAGLAIVELKPPAGAAVFTDDLAPVEEMTRRMLGTHQQ